MKMLVECTRAPQKRTLRALLHDMDPAVVTDRGRPRFIVRPGKTGFLARNLQEFVGCIQSFLPQGQSNCK
jgi:hypothetical protein